MRTDLPFFSRTKESDMQVTPGQIHCSARGPYTIGVIIPPDLKSRGAFTEAGTTTPTESATFALEQASHTGWSKERPGSGRISIQRGLGALLRALHRFSQAIPSLASSAKKDTECRSSDDASCGCALNVQIYMCRSTRETHRTETSFGGESGI
jgi:hypothetical protein